MATFVAVLVAVMMFMATSVFAQEPPRVLQPVATVSSDAGAASSTAEITAMETPKRPDSERVAQSFAGRKIKEFKNGYYAFARYENGRFSRWVQAEFEMTTKGKVTYLVIDGKVIVKRGDPPLDGLPSNVQGEARDFYVSLSAYDEKGQFIASGYFDKSLWLPKDPIKVKLDPIDIQVLVPFTVPDGVDSRNLRLQVNDRYNSSFQYKEYTHAFDVWVDPLFVLEYEIIDVSTGIVYGRGTLDTLAATSVKESDVSIVSVLLPEGVVDVAFDGDREYVFYERQTFSGHVVRDENCPSPVPSAPVTCGKTEVPAKVYFTDLDEMNFSVSVFSDSNDRFIIEVRRYVEKGEMPLIAKTNGDQSYLQIGRGYRQVVVTILPADQKNPAPNFYVSLSRY